MKRNLLAGLVFALAVPAAAFASDAAHSAPVKKHQVVAQAKTSADSKSAAGTATNGKSKKKSSKAKTSKPAAKSSAQKSEQMK
jgi:hypothetical protein